MAKHTEHLWAVVSVYGIYYFSFAPTRREAIAAHGDGDARYTWAQRYRLGDRAVRVTVTYEAPDA